MGTKAAKKVDFERLAGALQEYRFAYLVTVDDEYRVHTVTVEPAALRVVPTRALLHRNADPNTRSATGCLHDCVVFSER